MLVAAVAIVVAGVIGMAGPASAAVSACYSVSVTVNGEAVVDAADCQTAET